MRLLKTFAALAMGAYAALPLTQEAQALTPTTDQGQQQASMQESIGGFIRHMPYCCQLGELRVDAPTEDTSDGGANVTIDPSLYGLPGKEATVHVQEHTDGSWPHIISQEEAAGIEAKCKADPEEKRKDTCAPPSISIIFASPQSSAPQTSSDWRVWCLYKPPAAI